MTGHRATDMCMERNGAQGQQRYWKFPCDNCKHDGNDCPVPQMTTIEEITRFQKSVEITGCKHQLPAFDTAPLQAQPQDAAAGKADYYKMSHEQMKKIRLALPEEVDEHEEIPDWLLEVHGILNDMCEAYCTAEKEAAVSPGKASDVLGELRMIEALEHVASTGSMDAMNAYIAECRKQAEKRAKGDKNGKTN